MKYVIDKKELKELCAPFYESYRAFLKSKQPVREVASGYIFYNEDCCIDIGDKKGKELMPLQMLLDGQYKDKNIKIYVEVL